MIPALIGLGAGIVGVVMGQSFKQSFFPDPRLEQARQEALNLLRSR